MVARTILLPALEVRREPNTKGNEHSIMMIIGDREGGLLPEYHLESFGCLLTGTQVLEVLIQA